MSGPVWREEGYGGGRTAVHGAEGVNTFNKKKKTGQNMNEPWGT